MHWLVLNPDIQFAHARPKNALRAPIVVNHVLNVHILRYLDNNYFEEKYTKIPCNNKSYKEKVECVQGATLFLEAIGFQQQLLPHKSTHFNHNLCLYRDPLIQCRAQTTIHVP